MFRSAPSRPPPRVAAALAVLAVAWMTARCGGTTGREGLTVPVAPDSAAPVVDLDAGAFDVVVPYADRVIPDVAPAPAIDAAAFPWPSCPPFIPVDSNGQPVDPNEAGTFWVDQVPSVVDDAGVPSFAPDGSACATYGWLGSTAIDRCLTSNSADPFIDLPPCNWALDSGAAQSGARAGTPRDQLCYALYDCIARSGCATSNVNVCLCGANTSAEACIKAPVGPCFDEEMAALELKKDAVSDALKDFTDTAGHPVAGKLNQIFQTAESNTCFPSDGGALDGGP
jgi:hypothetical protein